MICYFSQSVFLPSLFFGRADLLYLGIFYAASLYSRDNFYTQNMRGTDIGLLQYICRDKNQQ